MIAWLWWIAYLSAITSERKETLMSNNVIPFPRKQTPKPGLIHSASIAEAYRVGHARTPSEKLQEAMRAVYQVLFLETYELAHARVPMIGDGDEMTFKPAMAELVEAIEKRVADVDEYIAQRKR